MKSLGRGLVLLFVFGVFSFLYLSPGGEALWQNRTDVVLSDGTDPVAAPHQFGLVLESFQQSPWLLLYGATPTWSYGSPEGAAIWNTWAERWFVVAVSPFVVLEQTSTAWVFFLMVASGLSMLSLGRFWRWSWPVSLGISFAWVFSVYVRARAKVHSGFVGIYHLPLIFLALLVLARGRGRRSVLLSASLLLVAATVSHYYLIMVAFAAPFFLFFYFWMASAYRPWPESLRRLCFAALPVLGFNLYCVLNPVPESLHLAEVFPLTGRSTELYHPYLDLFAARPFDYLTGDTGIAMSDPVPFREWLNQWNFMAFPVGNPHERTNGIRWLVWGIVLIGIFSWFRFLRRASRTEHRERREETGLLMLFSLLALFGFWLSLPPSALAVWGSPAYWLHSWLPQFRVSSRAGLFVQFSVLILCGIFLSRWERKWHLQIGSTNLSETELNSRVRRWLPEWRRWVFWLFPILILAEFPPLWNPMPMAAVAPRLESLQGLRREECGQGVSFPYVSASVATPDFYALLQRMRGSHCALINSPSDTRRDQKLAAAWGLTPNLLKALEQNDPRLRQSLLEGLSCRQLNFVIFDPRLPSRWSSDLCNELAGEWHHDGVCRFRAKEGRQDCVWLSPGG